LVFKGLKKYRHVTRCVVRIWVGLDSLEYRKFPYTYRESNHDSFVCHSLS